LYEWTHIVDGESMNKNCVEGFECSGICLFMINVYEKRGEEMSPVGV
jgi:hypothetical protein